MKYTVKFKFVLLAAVFLLPFTSCDDVTELNVDPNNPVEVPASNLLTQAQFQINNTLISRAYNSEWTMLLVQHWAQNEYAEDSRFNRDGNDFNGIWNTLYADVLSELNAATDIVNANEGLNASIKANQLAVIEILNVYTYHALVDGFGDIPYTQALNSVEFPLPQYDSQQDVYNALFARLESAVNSIDESAASFSSGDLIYNGDAAKWKKFGNSLMLRMAMRVVDADNGTATKFINQAAAGAFTSTDDNALFVFADDATLGNPVYRDASPNVGNRDDYAVSDVLVDNLQAFGDPRLEKFANPTLTGEIIGMPVGLTDGEAFALKPTTSRPSDLVRQATFPAVMMDYAEVQFILAEAYQRGILTGDAAAAYAEGIAASMNFWGIDDQVAIDAYVAANPYDAANWKESLGWQKWIAFYMNGPQAWAEWRRLDFPQLELPPAAVIDQIPTRLAYPIAEQQTNNSALEQVTSDPNDLMGRLFWDMN